MKPTSIHPIVAELKNVRKAWKITLAELEDRAGVGMRTLQHSEGGQHSPTLRTLMFWAEALGYEIVLRPKMNRRPLGPMKKPLGPICTDCGNKPSQDMTISFEPVVMSTERCRDCFETWAKQVHAVHRALR